MTYHQSNSWRNSSQLSSKFLLKCLNNNCCSSYNQWCCRWNHKKKILGLPTKSWSNRFHFSLPNSTMQTKLKSNQKLKLMESMAQRKMSIKWILAHTWTILELLTVPLILKEKENWKMQTDTDLITWTEYVLKSHSFWAVSVCVSLSTKNCWLHK